LSSYTRHLLNGAQRADEDCFHPEVTVTVAGKSRDKGKA
jgi:hypothetical protein